jgi:hypothetical protein
LKFSITLYFASLDLQLFDDKYFEYC